MTPEMAAARADALATIGQFRELYASHRRLLASQSAGYILGGRIGMDGEGDVVGLTDFNVTVQLHGRPSSHRGSFQPIQSFPIREIADWLVVTADGKYRGGFTQRVHFDRMRKAGTLVGAAAEEASRFE